MAGRGLESNHLPPGVFIRAQQLGKTTSIRLDPFPLRRRTLGEGPLSVDGERHTVQFSPDKISHDDRVSFGHLFNLGRSLDGPRPLIDDQTFASSARTLLFFFALLAFVRRPVNL